MHSASAARSNWLSSLNWQFDFYQSSSRKNRVDPEFEWGWDESRYPKGFKAIAKVALAKLLWRLRVRFPGGATQEWVNNNATLLWEARALLEDDLSKLLFSVR